MAKTGRKLAPIESEQVEKLAQIGATNAEIGGFFGVDESTIRKRFSDILLKARESGKIRLRQLQWKSATAGNVVMQIFLGKNILGQSDKTVEEIENMKGITKEDLDDFFKKHSDENPVR